MKLILFFLYTLIFSLSAQAHDIGQGRFDPSGIRTDVIEFVAQKSAELTPPNRLQSPEELALQSWIDTFTQAPRNRAFFNGERFQVWIEESGQFNAYVVPSGQIRVTRALFEVARDAPEYLRAILAHELAHVSRAHAIRNAARAFGDQPFAALEGRTATPWGTARNLFMLYDVRKQGRAFELEADQVGMEMLNNVGMDPGLLPLALEALDKSANTASPSIFAAGLRPDRVAIQAALKAAAKVCSTHPETCERVSSAYDEIKMHSYENAWSRVPEPRGAILEWLENFERLPVAL